MCDVIYFCLPRSPSDEIFWVVSEFERKKNKTKQNRSQTDRYNRSKSDDHILIYVIQEKNKIKKK